MLSFVQRHAAKVIGMLSGFDRVRLRGTLRWLANDRYLQSLAAVDGGESLGALTTPLCQPVQWRGRRVRALNPLAGDDALLLKSVSRGEFLINGFRNRDLRGLLYGAAPSDAAEGRRQSSAITRRLRMLRGHGLITKVVKTHRYVLTEKARTVIAALLAAQQADAAQLSQIAA